MPYHVCPDCNGRGYKSKLPAFTGDDLEEQFGSDLEARQEFLEEYKKEGGIYDDPCPTCKTLRVVTGEQLDEWEDEAVIRAEIAHESRMGY